MFCDNGPAFPLQTGKHPSRNLRGRRAGRGERTSAIGFHHAAPLHEETPRSRGCEGFKGEMDETARGDGSVVRSVIQLLPRWA